MQKHTLSFLGKGNVAFVFKYQFLERISKDCFIFDQLQDILIAELHFQSTGFFSFLSEAKLVLP